jgi:hypothetical protein
MIIVQHFNLLDFFPFSVLTDFVVSEKFSNEKLSENLCDCADFHFLTSLQEETSNINRVRIKKSQSTP